MGNRDNMTDEIQHVIIASLEGRATAGELQRLRGWMEEAPEHAAMYEEWSAMWRQAGREQRYDVDGGWKSVEKRMGGNMAIRRKRLMHRWVGAAAAVALLVAGGAWYALNGWQASEGVQTVVENIEPGSKKAVLFLEGNRQVELEENCADSLFYGNEAVKQEGNTLVYSNSKRTVEALEYNRLVTPRGGEYAVVLSDGTKVWLNAESELKYPVRFAGGERKVYLKGEAYFDVAKRDGQKFMVCSDKAEVTVLGTEFNVKNYEGGAIATTLVEGSVTVECDGEECLLKPGQQAMIDEGGMDVREVETILYTAWKDGFFVYRETTLDHILQELSRWYDFTYFYRNEQIGALRLTAKIRKFDSVESIFEILETTGQLDFEVKGKTVTVMTK